MIALLQMAEELNAASVLVVSSPIWNFSFPYVLKQYIDIALQPGINFLETPSGPGEVPQLPQDVTPVTRDKHLVLITSRGGKYGPNNPADHLGPYLRHGLSRSMIGIAIFYVHISRSIFGMLGFTRSHEVLLEGAMHRSRTELLESAAESCRRVAGDINLELGRR